MKYQWLVMNLLAVSALSFPPARVQAEPLGEQTPSSSVASSEFAETIAEEPIQDLSLLFQKIWRVTDARSEPNLDSVHVFLPNGTVLSTSCGEPYRIATWLIPDRQIPSVLAVTEDGEVAYTAEILELSSTTLRLRQNLVRSGEQQEITLTAIEEEFVCPDLPR
jgi:hypothetical protein